MLHARSVMRLPPANLFACFFAVSLLPTSVMAQQTTSACPQMPGRYVKLPNQPYALCAGAQAVNYNEITYAKCTHMYGTSISSDQSYPFPSDNPSGNIVTVNQGAPSAGGYVVSTYSPPPGATTSSGDLAIYTCDEGGTFAQCDGGICFTSTVGKSSPLWGEVESGKNGQIICSCPVVTTKLPFQVMGPKPCPTDRATYDAVCGANVSKINNGAIIYIGAPPGGFETLAVCLGNTSSFNKCKRP
jgi:hypothetical protein